MAKLYSSDYLYEEEAEDEETATDNTMIYQSIFLIILLIGAGILTYMIYRKHDDAKKEREYVEKHSGQLPGVWLKLSDSIHCTRWVCMRL